MNTGTCLFSIIFNDSDPMSACTQYPQLNIVILIGVEFSNKGNAKRDVSPRLKI